MTDHKKMDALTQYRCKTIEMSEHLGSTVTEQILSIIDQEIVEARAPVRFAPEAASDRIDLFCEVGPTRRYPIYFLVDQSNAMEGGGLEAAEMFIIQAFNELVYDPFAVEIVWVSVIGIAQPASLISSLTPLLEFTPPAMVKHTTPPDLSLALAMLARSTQNDLRGHTRTHKGDYRPTVFILTSGRFPNERAKEISELQALKKNLGKVILVLCGEQPDRQAAYELSSTVLDAACLSRDKIKQCLCYNWEDEEVPRFSDPV